MLPFRLSLYTNSLNRVITITRTDNFTDEKLLEEVLALLSQIYPNGLHKQHFSYGKGHLNLMPSRLWAPSNETVWCISSLLLSSTWPFLFSSKSGRNKTTQLTKHGLFQLVFSKTKNNSFTCSFSRQQVPMVRLSRTLYAHKFAALFGRTVAMQLLKLRQIRDKPRSIHVILVSHYVNRVCHLMDSPLLSPEQARICEFSYPLLFLPSYPSFFLSILSFLSLVSRALRQLIDKIRN